MIVGPGQRHDPRPAHATVRRLQPDDTAAGSRQADRAAGVAAEGAERQPRGHRNPGTARRAAGDVPRAPGILDMSVVRVVPERAHRQLGHVELAERDRSGLDQPRDGGAVVLGHEVFRRLRATRRS